MRRLAVVGLLFSVLLGACTWTKSPDALGELNYVVGQLDKSPIDASRSTHFLVVGASGGAGLQFYAAAVTRALRYRELFPTRQIVILSGRESGTAKDFLALQEIGLQVIVGDLETLGGERLLQLLMKFQSIESIDFYTHSSPWGVSLSGGASKLTENTFGLQELASHFTSDAYVTLNGCNGAFYLAPFFSAAWKVPVSGALTSTNFVQLHSDGNWYISDEKQAPNQAWADWNRLSFEKPQECLNTAGCLRMRPDNQPYNGYYGRFGDGGLPFFKFFCNFEGDEKECSRRMALSMLSFPSIKPLSIASSDEDFQDNVLEHLCPDFKDATLRKKCMTDLQSAAQVPGESFSTFLGTMTACDMKSCDIEQICQKDITGQMIVGSCVNRQQPNPKPRTMIEEYLHFVDGWQQLKLNPPQDHNGPVAQIVFTPGPLVSIETQAPTPTATPIPVPIRNDLNLTEEIRNFRHGNASMSLSLRVERKWYAGESILFSGKTLPLRTITKVVVLERGVEVASAFANALSGGFTLRFNLSTVGLHTLKIRGYDASKNVVVEGAENVIILP